MPIFDQGYQHWSGELSGHGWRWLAIARNGVRGGMKSWLLRIVLLLSWVPALMLAGFLCAWGLLERKSAIVQVLLSAIQPGITSDPKHYRLAVWTLAYHVFLWIELRLSMAIIMLVGPSLISQDLRFNALPLYFSRPLRRMDYFIGKLAVIAAFLGMVIIVPSVVAYVLGLLFTLDVTVIRDTLPLLGSVIIYGAIFSVSAGMLILAMSALSRSSRYVMLGWMAFWFITVITSVVLQAIAFQQRRAAYWHQGPQDERIVMQAPPGATSDELRRIRQERMRRRTRAQLEFEAEEMRLDVHDWRALISYTGNVDRIESSLLQINAAWQELSLLQPTEDDRARFLARWIGPQNPWYWSAAVLAALCGISACILHFPIRSMDRLK